MLKTIYGAMQYILFLHCSITLEALWLTKFIVGKGMADFRQEDFQ